MTRKWRHLWSVRPTRRRAKGKGQSVIASRDKLGFQSQQTLFRALLPLSEQLEREGGELRLQGRDLLLHVWQPGSQIGVGKSGGKPPALGPGWPWTDSRSAGFRLEHPVMQAGQGLNLLDFQALDFGIRRISMLRHLGLCQPLAQCFLVDGKQTTAFSKGKTGHEKNSFWQTAETIRHDPGIFPGKNRRIAE